MKAYWLSKNSGQNFINFFRTNPILDRGEIKMKENKDARIEIRLPIRIKEVLQTIAKEEKTTMSKIIYSLILSKLEENKNGKSN